MTWTDYPNDFGGRAVPERKIECSNPVRRGIAHAQVPRTRDARKIRCLHQRELCCDSWKQRRFERATGTRRGPLDKVRDGTHVLLRHRNEFGETSLLRQTLRAQPKRFEHRAVRPDQRREFTDAVIEPSLDVVQKCAGQDAGWILRETSGRTDPANHVDVLSTPQ